MASWTLFLDCFTHLRTGAAAIDNRVLMAGLLADGLNLGLTRMAEACGVATLGQLAWTSDWHIREETYALALQRLVNQQQREPFAAMFGSGGPHHPTVSFSRPVASATTPADSTRTMARSQGSRFIRTSRIATRPSTPS